MIPITVESAAGSTPSANAVFTSAQVQPSLGRPLASAATVTVNVVRPGSLYGERMRQLDLRFGRQFNLKTRVIRASIDLFNFLNGNAVLTLNNAYGTDGAAWLQPGTILAARLVKFGVQVEF